MELYIISWRLLGKSIKTHTILDCHLMEGGKQFKIAELHNTLSSKFDIVLFFSPNPIVGR